jgi:plastocyanin
VHALGCVRSDGPAATAPRHGPAATAAGASADVAASIRVLDFKLDPATLSVTGTTLALSVANAGPTVHNVTVRDAAGTVLFGSKDLREGEAETIVHAIAPGTYVLFCSLPGHESLGVKGTLTVTAP